MNNKMTRNEEEEKKIDVKLKREANKILSKYGPEGALKIISFLTKIVVEDVNQVTEYEITKEESNE